MTKRKEIQKAVATFKKRWHKNVITAVVCWVVWTAIFFVAGQIFIEAVMPGAVSLEAHVNGPRVMFGQIIPALLSVTWAGYLISACAEDRRNKLIELDRRIARIKFKHMING